MNFKTLVASMFLVGGSYARGNDAAGCMIAVPFGLTCNWYYSNGKSRSLGERDLADGCRSLPQLPVREFCFDRGMSRAHFFWGEGPNQDEKRCMHFSESTSGNVYTSRFTEVDCTW